MRKTKFISALLVLGLVLSILPAANVYADTIDVCDTEDYGLMKAYEPLTNLSDNNDIIYVAPGEKATLSFRFPSYVDSESLEIVKYTWLRLSYSDYNSYVEKTVAKENYDNLNCNKSTYTFEPTSDGEYLCIAEMSNGDEYEMNYVIHMDLGLTVSQNIYYYVGDEGESVRVAVSPKLINPKGKVSYEWYYSSIDSSPRYKLEKLESTTANASAKIPTILANAICLIKYTDGKYTQIERRTFGLTNYNSPFYRLDTKGANAVVEGESLSVFSKDPTTLKWYYDRKSNTLIDSGVASIKTDKPGYYICEDTTNNRKYGFYAYKKVGDLQAGKPVNGSVQGDVKVGYYFTPAVSGKYSFEVTNYENVNINVTKKEFRTPYDPFCNADEVYARTEGIIMGERYEKCAMHMFAGETYLILVSAYTNNIYNDVQPYQLKMSLVENECKHSSNFIVGDKAATLFATGATGDKYCAWCNSLIEKNKAVNKKQIKLSAKAIKKGAKLSWKKQTGVAGYQLRYATNKSFKKAKTVDVSKKSISKTLSKLTSKKKYYFAIRAYKKSGKKKVYSSWSKTVSVKIK